MPNPRNDTLIIFIALLLRIFVGYGPYSGQNNHHGANGDRYGDFEAQRHWMEMALHLPWKDIYYYDLEYWGMDYPPLSVWQSYICGFASHYIVGSESVALDTSRGYEEKNHKAFMRATVLVFDLIFYVSAVAYILRGQSQKMHVVLALVQPGMLLIDHGHFQYNCVALGLSLWACYFYSRRNFINCIFGSILFCAALSFKQMSLYYAPAIFFFLLGRCCSSGNFSVQKFLFLGASVIMAMAAFWGAILAFPPDGVSASEHVYNVIRRIIPLKRGFFENKVANIWFSLSVKPLRIPQRIPTQMQPIVALVLTCVLMAPSCARLFSIGQHMPQRLDLLLWGMTSCALAFFLASFQVHEKSLLLALAPASMLSSEDSGLIDWFSIVVVWTLWPLLVLDRLQITYCCIIGIYLCLVRLLKFQNREKQAPTTKIFFGLHPLLGIIPSSSYLAMILLHVAELWFEPRPELPDLFPVLWSVLGCGMCCVMYVATLYHIFSTPKFKTT